MTGNIIGEEFQEYVLDQIQSRQKLQGKGIDGTPRSAQDINYLSNRNAWIKMASSVSVGDMSVPKDNKIEELADQKIKKFIY